MLVLMPLHCAASCLPAAPAEGATRPRSSLTFGLRSKLEHSSLHLKNLGPREVISPMRQTLAIGYPACRCNLRMSSGKVESSSQAQQVA